MAEQVWSWLADPSHRAVLVLWTESCAAALLDPDGPWGCFARTSVADWLSLLAKAQPADVRSTAVLRRAFLDLIATGDTARTTRAVRSYLDRLGQ